jgi:hypothetical protein
MLTGSNLEPPVKKRFAAVKAGAGRQAGPQAGRPAARKGVVRRAGVPRLLLCAPPGRKSMRRGTLLALTQQRAPHCAAAGAGASNTRGRPPGAAGMGRGGASPGTPATCGAQHTGHGPPRLAAKSRSRPARPRPAGPASPAAAAWPGAGLRGVEVRRAARRGGHIDSCHKNSGTSQPRAPLAGPYRARRRPSRGGAAAAGGGAWGVGVCGARVPWFLRGRKGAARRRPPGAGISFSYVCGRVARAGRRWGAPAAAARYSHEQGGAGGCAEGARGRRRRWRRRGAGARGLIDNTGRGAGGQCGRGRRARARASDARTRGGSPILHEHTRARPRPGPPAKRPAPGGGAAARWAAGPEGGWGRPFTWRPSRRRCACAR